MRDFTFWWPIPIDLPRATLGFGYRARGTRHRAIPGYRWLPDYSRNSAVLYPLWLYWPVRLWRDRQFYWFTPWMVLGFWRVEGGELYKSGRWQWRFWLPEMPIPLHPLVKLSWPFLYHWRP